MCFFSPAVDVKGANFITPHELFDKVDEDVEDFVDLIAERAIHLGGTVDATVRMVAKRSTLAEYPSAAPAGPIMSMPSPLRSHLFGKLERQAIKTSDEFGDADSADIFT